jgi:hypothetical protein
MHLAPIIMFKLTKPYNYTRYQFVLLFACNLCKTKLVINPLLCNNQLKKHGFFINRYACRLRFFDE